MAPSRIRAFILKKSEFVFGPPVSVYPLPTPNDIIFGLLGSQAPRMQPHLGWGPPKTLALAPKVSRAGPGPDTSGHFWTQKWGKSTLGLDFFGAGAPRPRVAEFAVRGEVLVRFQTLSLVTDRSAGPGALRRLELEPTSGSERCSSWPGRACGGAASRSRSRTPSTSDSRSCTRDLRFFCLGWSGALGKGSARRSSPARDCSGASVPCSI